MRFVLLDVDTGTIYGEMHPIDDQDLLGFLARAWSVKRDHPMRGIPELLQVSKSVLSDSTMCTALNLLMVELGLSVAQLPSGYVAGVYAVKNYENTLRMVLCGGGDVELELVHSLSAALSAQAAEEAMMWNQDWRAIDGPGDAFAELIDRQYESVGAWRVGPYSVVLQGLGH